MGVDPYDVVLIGVVVASVGSAIVGTRLVKRATQRYLPGDADLYAIAQPGQPFALDIPAGPALDVMLRYRVERVGPKGGHRHGLTVLVEAQRELPQGGFRDGARPFELRHERVIGWAGKPLGAAPVAPGEPSYAVTREPGAERHTSVIARLPAGGAGVVRGRVEVALAVDDLVLFAKPS